VRIERQGIRGELQDRAGCVAVNGTAVVR